jgi:Zn-dependent oligopeptidase
MKLIIHLFLGTRWKPRNLTYNISKYSKHLSPPEIDSIIQSAFEVWENVANLTFTRAYDGKVHIDIRFETLYHGDEEVHGQLYLNNKFLL